MRLSSARVRPDKQRILASLQCGETSPAFQEIDEIIELAMAGMEETAKPIAWFRRIPQSSFVNLPQLRDCSALYLCLVSLGKGVDQEIRELFLADRYLEGMVLDATATQMLFRLSEELYVQVVADAATEGFGLTCRLTPGETEGVDLKNQAEIVRMAVADGYSEIKLTNGLMLDPVKSLAYIYGAAVGLPMNGKDHDCSLCGKIDCQMRRPDEGEQNITLTVFDGVRQERITVSPGQRLLEVLRKKGMHVNAPCGGLGTCGKCKVVLKEGRVRLEVGDSGSPEFAGAGNEALACRSILVENCMIDVSWLQEPGFVGNSDFLASASQPIDTGIEMLRFVPAEEIWNSGRSVTEEINSSLGRTLTFTPKALRQLSSWMGAALGKSYSGPDANSPISLSVRENRVIGVRTEESEPVYGMGVDIGTTTVAFSLVDLVTGNVRKAMSLLNSQRKYGADVISRIQKSADGFSGELQECIRSDIFRGINAMCEGEKDFIVQMVIAGNTTMLHLLLGLQAESLALFPFNPVTTSISEISSAELFGEAPVNCEVVLLPSVGAYMGADIVAGMMSCNMDRSEGVSLFIDVGTNGEIAIGGRDRILCVSTAAGPAFEGANITWGTGSIPGAIAAFNMQEGKISFRTIDEAPPVGICGSAVVDIVAAGLREGVLDRTGLFKSEITRDNGLKITQNQAGEWICFTQKDVREFQLAKSAIRSGIEILLSEYGCSWEDVDNVYLAGGFGTKMDVRNAVEVGLFPRQLEKKILPVGNSALGGTVQYLLSRERREAVKALAQMAEVIDLSKHPAFNDLFVEQLRFEDEV